MTDQPTTTLLLAALAALALPCLSSAAQTGETRVITGFAKPESVLVHGDRRYVANVGRDLKPTAADGDGFISELDADGGMLNLHAFPLEGEVLNTPKGMAIVGGRLYVADIDRVIGFDLATRHKIFERFLPAGSTAFANDIAVLDDETLLVTDTNRGVVYRLPLESGDISVWATGIPGANGIVHDKATGRTFVVGLGANATGGDLFTIDEAGKATMVAGAPHGLLDGISLLPDGGLLVSDWIGFDGPTAGKLWRASAMGSVTGSVDLGPALHGPADFAVDAARGVLWIPSMPDDSVRIVPLP